jgi:Flp pilus assembly protein TadG
VRQRGRDRGSAVVDFAVVSGLLVVVVLAVLQLALGMHTRTSLVASAAEGARQAAGAGGTLESGMQRTRELVGEVLPAADDADVTG